MNYELADSPLTPTQATREKMERWVAAQGKGEKVEVDIYGKPSSQQLKELENVRNLSKELQNNLQELENTARNTELDNEAMNPTAPILDFSEDHDFLPDIKNTYYAEEDKLDAKEEEKQKLTKGKGPKTEIQKFYTDQCVFITGGTGFLGKVLIEKLLRACPDVDTLYVLVRTKKGKDPQSRLHEMLDEFLFHRAHKENPKGIHKVVAIVGDVGLPGLGMSEEDRKLITSRVTVIINGAATVKFDEKLSISTAINVKGTKEVLKLAKECRYLKAITHISTAFSNTQEKLIEEKFYEPPMSVEALEAVCQLDNNLVETILPNLLGKRPNTYCLTKAVAEDAVRIYGEGLPICIFRPSIVVSTYEEPVRGWTDSFYGPTGLVVGTGTGVLRTMYMDLDKVADMIPVDLCVNAILASAWCTAKNYKENQTSSIPIYNYVSGAQNPITWREFINTNQKYGIDKPTLKAVWYYGLNPTNNFYLFLFYNFFLHFIPALLVDVYATITGGRRGMIKLYNKVMKLAHILFYFTTQEWKFSDNNVRSMWNSLTDSDKVIFPFAISEMSWDYMLETFLVGLRVYLIKEDLSTLPEARKKWNRLYVLHQILRGVTLTVVLYLVYTFLKLLLSVVIG